MLTMRRQKTAARASVATDLVADIRAIPIETLRERLSQLSQTSQEQIIADARSRDRQRAAQAAARARSF